MNTPSGKPRKVIPIASADPQNEIASLYEAQKKVYPRSISGYFARWRWILVFFTQIVFYGLPWLQWGERQIMLFDLGARRFYLFGLVLYPQDFIYLTTLLIISALALFLFTAVAGRLWCGFACPQTVYTEIFMWIEHKIEKETVKQFLWIAVSVWTGFTFGGYFVPIRQLGGELRALQGTWQIFWVLFYGFATYGNAGFLRAQVCKYMCPYARFQSAMFDRDTLIISYDSKRGEPRGARSRKADAKALGQGDCIDCTLCVQVCPVGIDIRNGLQYECIGCGLCVDACNTVMDKMQYPGGVIRFSTQNGVSRGWGKVEILKRVMRPRVLIYSGILVAMSLGMLLSLAVRTPFNVDVVRDRAALARIVAGGKLENIYRLQIMNATEVSQHYRLSVSGLEGAQLVAEPEYVIEPAQSRWVVVQVHVPYGSLPEGSHPVRFEVLAVESGAKVL